MFKECQASTGFPLSRPIDCIWMENPLSDDNRAHYATNSLLNLGLDHAEVGFVHRNGWKEKPEGCKGAVIVVHGEHQVPIADELLSQVMSLEWSLTINTGDEQRVFPLHKFNGGRHKVWMQFPLPGFHDYVSRRLTAGYPHDCPAYLHLCQREMANKTYNFSYMGQVNNQSRKECVAQLRMIPHGFLHESPGFWQGLPREEYYRKTAASKVVACPAGGAWPESLRVFEALEARAIPIVEDKVFNGVSYWRYVLGEESPFPTLKYWSDFPVLFDRALREWPANSERLQGWWTGYKQRMSRWFEEDLRELGAL